MQNSGKEIDISKDITRKSKTNFLYSFTLLSKEKNDAINTVYAFCRKTDDIVDDTGSDMETKSRNLEQWKSDLESALTGSSKERLLNKLSTVIKEFNIPHKPFFDLIRGMGMDLEKSRYEAFDELYEYCYCAAGTVGLMCIEIFGYNNPKTREFAVALGVALQLTNIIRDIKKDADAGRIYIPKEDMERFGYSEKDLLENKYNDKFIQLMRFEADRARSYYQKANELLVKEDKGLMFSARIMGHIYFDLLKRIERRKFNVFKNTAKVPRIKKIFLTFAVYFKYRLLYNFNDPRSVGKKVQNG